MKRIVLLLLGLWAFHAQAQCPTGGAPTTYGSGSWTGYVFDGIQNFTNYQGSITESATFDESFCGDDCFFNTSNCTVETESFTIRFKMQQSFTNSVYRLIIGGDDGERLSIDGGSTQLIDQWNDHGYVTVSNLAVLNGNTNLVLDYYDNDRANRISFSYVNLGPSWGALRHSARRVYPDGKDNPKDVLRKARDPVEHTGQQQKAH